MLLIFSFEAVAAVGGRCASGQTAYQIRTTCPDVASDFLPWVIFTALIAVAIGLIFAFGVGFQLAAWAWPITFGSLGALFFSNPDVEGILLGLMFVIMALVPLVIELRGSVQRTFVGSKSVTGRQFADHPNAKKSIAFRGDAAPEGSARPGAGDWAFALLGAAVAIVAGYFVAYEWVVSIISH